MISKTQPKAQGTMFGTNEFPSYEEIMDAYAFHNLYPYKGKFYPRVVRTLINAFELNQDSLLLDPFNGSGTATHESSLMGIKSVGIDVTPMGIVLSQLKNDLLFY
jgi:tRNA G10  N-methylase Trm11